MFIVPGTFYDPMGNPIAFYATGEGDREVELLCLCAACVRMGNAAGPVDPINVLDPCDHCKCWIRGQIMSRNRKLDATITQLTGRGVLQPHHWGYPGRDPKEIEIAFKV